MNATVLYTDEDRQFYPTPAALVHKLLDMVDLKKVDTILEPSAGKGDLVKEALKYVGEKFHQAPSLFFRVNPLDNISVDMVEIDPNLRAILDYQFGGTLEDELRGKLQIIRRKAYSDRTEDERAEEHKLDILHDIHKAGRCRIVGDDFLSFYTQKRYALILMNPPFENGDLHLIKALQMQERYGGQIACILNAETIRNPFSNSRKMLKGLLDKFNAKIEFVENGFTSAERRTGVEVALIAIDIPVVEEHSFILEGLEKAKEEDRKHAADRGEVIDADPIKAMVAQFNYEIRGGIRLIEEYEAYKPYMLNAFKNGKNDAYVRPMLSLELGSHEATVNSFVKKVRSKYWDAFFRNDDFTGRLTSKMRDEFLSTVDEMENYDFSEFNIRQILDRIQKSVVKGVEESIVETFDKLSEKHRWYPECEENIHYYNGWASNKAHKINKKVILPINGCFSVDWYSKKAEGLDVRTIMDTLADIEKSFDYLDMGRTEPVDLHDVLEAANARQTSRKIPCKYFNVTFYKKGTAHIEFTDEELLDKMNIFGSQKKNWLPPCYGRKHYKQMSPEEQSVIDEFQGEEKYEEVLTKADYYLADIASSMPLLAEGGKNV